tara:strand:- start:302 stop:478 length:177 start_codon:yes stop_codon:yes gene_type:complete
MEIIEIARLVCVGLVVAGAYLHGNHVGKITGRSETVDYLIEHGEKTKDGVVITLDITE